MTPGQLKSLMESSVVVAVKSGPNFVIQKQRVFPAGPLCPLLSLYGHFHNTPWISWPGDLQIHQQTVLVLQGA